MGNKTIYLSDEKLWKEAKKLAGKEGLSSVIVRALRQFVADKKLELEGYEDLRFAAGFGGADRITFRGKMLKSGRYLVSSPGDVWPPQAFEDEDQISVVIEIYLTLKGTFVVIAELAGRGEAEHIPIYWKSHQGINSLKADAALATLEPVDRANLLDAVAPVDDDWATRIE